MNKNLREEIIKYGKIIYEGKHVEGTGGNISVRVPQDRNLFMITPSGMSYNKLNPEDIVVCNLDGKVIKGNRKPSIEHNLHAEIYKVREDVDAIIHTHSLYSTALAIARTPLPAIEAGLALIGDTIEVADYANPGTKELAQNVVKTLGKKGAVLVANHGLVAVSSNLKKAFNIVERIEHGGRLYFLASTAGKVFMIPKKECEEIRQFVAKKYGQKII